MKPTTAEWIAKAEADLVTAQRELRARKSPNYDGAAFHAQQCAEKYLKARLVEAEVAFPKTHDLSVILDLVLVLEPGWESLRYEVSLLTDLAVEVRYPGATAELQDARRAVATARQVRNQVRARLGLE